jgi:hypothetical protein
VYQAFCSRQGLAESGPAAFGLKSTKADIRLILAGCGRKTRPYFLKGDQLLRTPKLAACIWLCLQVLFGSGLQGQHIECAVIGHTAFAGLE